MQVGDSITRFKLWYSSPLIFSGNLGKNINRYLCSLIAPDVYVLWSTLFLGLRARRCLSGDLHERERERGNFSSATLIIFPSPLRHQWELFHVHIASQAANRARNTRKKEQWSCCVCTINDFGLCGGGGVAFCFLVNLTNITERYRSDVTAIRSTQRVLCACRGIWFLSKICICI